MQTVGKTALLCCLLVALGSGRSQARVLDEKDETKAPAGKAEGEGGLINVPPNVGAGRLLVDPTKAPHRPMIPDELKKDGAKYWGMFKVCVSDAGEVSDVRILKSTGHPDLLDGPWVETIRSWTYRPYQLKDGKVVPFCYPLRLQVHAKA